MIYGSICSGIEAASAAWHQLGWRAAFLSEIEPFPRAVLQHHYPDVPLHGDFTTIREGDYAAIDLLVGGTPCQSFSVAGLRKGLDDDRGNLAIEYLRLADRLRPRWLVWENVPGVLSSNGGRDFGSILGGMVELGYGFAYRVLDAQYVRVDGFGRAVPQRRRRVFLVGYLGDWRRAAAVLFERESLRGNPAPRREAGKVSAPTLAARTRGGGGLGTDFDCDETQITSAENRCQPRAGDPSHPLAAGARPPTIAFNARQDPDVFDGHTGPLDTDGSTQAVLSNGEFYGQETEANSGALLRRVREALGAEAFPQWGLGILASLQPAEILRSALHGSELRPAAFSRSWVVCCALGSPFSSAEGAMQSLREARSEGRTSQGREPSEQFARELGAYLSELSQPGAQAERFMRDLWLASEGLGLLRQTLSAVQKARRPSRSEGQPILSGWRVRRLMVEECEFLQGFPRDYTAIPYRGKHAADGPRYKALGNSMAVNVMRWIGRRIEMADSIERAA